MYEEQLLSLVKSKLNPILAVKLFSRGVTPDRLSEISSQMLGIQNFAISLADCKLF